MGRRALAVLGLWSAGACADDGSSAAATATGSSSGLAETTTTAGEAGATAGSSDTQATSSGAGTDTTATSGTGSTSSSGTTVSTTASETGPGTDSDGGTDTGTELVSACSDVDIGPLRTSVSGDTTLLADDHDPPCTPGIGGHDAGHTFVPPLDAFYAFATAGTAFDTVVYGWSPGCGDAVIGCNDDAGLGDPTSRLRTFLPAGQPVVVVVDGWDATQLGPYDLGISAVVEPCVDIDLGMAGATTLDGSTVGELDKLDAPCIASSGPEQIVRWVAPSDGAWTISTVGSAFDTVVYVYPGECAGVPVACNDDASPAVLTSQVVVAPGAGQPITIVVDGYSAADVGDWTLTLSSP